MIQVGKLKNIEAKIVTNPENLMVIVRQNSLCQIKINLQYMCNF